MARNPYRLTKWEQAIHDLLVLEGLSSREIAKRLGNTNESVKIGAKRVLEKKQIRTRIKLVVNYYQTK